MIRIILIWIHLWLRTLFDFFAHPSATDINIDGILFKKSKKKRKEKKRNCNKLERENRGSGIEILKMNQWQCSRWEKKNCLWHIPKEFSMTWKTYNFCNYFDSIRVFFTHTQKKNPPSSCGQSSIRKRKLKRLEFFYFDFELRFYFIFFGGKLLNLFPSNISTKKKNKNPNTNERIFSVI